MFSDIPASERWGPFALDFDPAERLARTRTLRAIIHLLTGSRGGWLCTMLQACENAPDRLPEALHALNRLASRDYRSVIASYGALHCPRWNA